MSQVSDAKMREMVKPTVDAWHSLFSNAGMDAQSPAVARELESALIAFGIMLRDYHFTRPTEDQLEPLAYCAQLEYQDEDSHHVHQHPASFTADCIDCSSRLALLRRAVAL